MRFTGQYLDPQSGLYHLRARDYGTATGRFLQVDPLPQPLTWPHLAEYGYVGGRPTVYADPSGECFVVCAVVGGAIGFVAYGIKVAVSDEEAWSWRAAGASTLNGAIVGGTAGIAGPLGGSVAKTLGFSSASATARVATGVFSAAGGVAGSAASGAICGSGSAPDSLTSGATAAVGTFAGTRLYPMRGVHTYAQRRFSPHGIRGFIKSSPNAVALRGATAVGGVFSAATVFTTNTRCSGK